MGSDIPGLVGVGGRSSRSSSTEGYPGSPVSSRFHLKAQKIGLRLPGCSRPEAGGGINLSKCCQVSRLNPVKSWAGGCQERPDGPFVRLSLGSQMDMAENC